MKNVFTIFVSPEETFKRVRDSKTAWIIALAVSIVLSLVTVYLQMPLIEQVARETLQKNAQIDPAMIDSFVAQTVTMTWVMAPISAIAGVFILALLFLLLNLIVRGEAKYMQLVSVASFGALPGIVGSLLTGIIGVAAGAESATDVTISLAAFVTDTASKAYRLLSLANPFSIWNLILYVIGAAVMMRRPRKKVALWIVGTWLVFSVGSVLLF
ncbi:YIP1 family protein [Paenibacillus sp. M1]|uniref:YIP1 family protein n=1 Tax=Paenibacillus haidiansis TaxID=1574488 RepID=A0ABU7VS08_9BACL